LSLRGKTFRIDQPGYLPGPVAITYVDAGVIILFAGIMARIFAAFLGNLAMSLGFIVGAAIGYTLWQGVKRSLPGPNATYYLDWISIQADHYMHKPDKEHYPLIVYGE